MTQPPCLLKSKSTKAHPGLKWDESNLEENEKIKAELPPVKITEPKTPYHAPLDGDADPEALHLDGIPAGASHSTFDAARARHYAKEALAASRKQIEEELAAEDGGK